MKQGRTVIAVLAAFVVVLAGAAPIPAVAQENVDVAVPWTRRVIYTTEFGVDRPVGLTVDTASGTFYSIEAGTQALVGITPYEDAADVIQISDVTDPLNVLLDTPGARLLALTADAPRATMRRWACIIDLCTDDLVFATRSAPRLMTVPRMASLWTAAESTVFAITTVDPIPATDIC